MTRKGEIKYFLNDNEYSNNIESFLQSISLKEEFMKRIEIMDISLTYDEDS